MAQAPNVLIPALAPGSTLGVLGGGQLGRMFVTAARTIGYEVVVLDPNPHCPAGGLASEQIVAAYDDQEAWAKLAERCEAVTCEFENVPASALCWLSERGVPVAPRANAVQVAQDRLAEKETVEAAGYQVAPYRPICASTGGLSTVGEFCFPAILKSARLGYDGKGQVQVANRESLEAAWEELGRVDCVLEQRIDLAMEVSVIVVRGFDGEARSYPCIENRHRSGILDLSSVPAKCTDQLDAKARQCALRIAKHLDYVGVLTVEFFVDQGGALYVNEMAPRPHNSGHLSINAAPCNQFEQQLRVLCGLPIGECAWSTPAAMLNLLGDLWSPRAPDFSALMRVQGCSVHLYGKSEARPGRKMGHLTVTAPDLAELDNRVSALREILGQRGL